MLATDRLKRLFDDPEDVLELSQLAGLGLAYGNIPRAGIIIGNSKISIVTSINCLKYSSTEFFNSDWSRAWSILHRRCK